MCDLSVLELAALCVCSGIVGGVVAIVGGLGVLSWIAFRDDGFGRM